MDWVSKRYSLNAEFPPDQAGCAMFKARIIHKGLILVAVPLFFGITFLSVLLYGLSESNRILHHELLLKDAIIADNVSMRNTFAAKVSSMAYLLSKDKYFKDRFIANARQATSSYEHLQDLLKNEPELKVPSRLARQDLVAGLTAASGHGATRHITHSGSLNYLAEMRTFMKTLQGLASKETAAALQSMNSLQIVLIAGMVASVVITVLLAVFFCLNITSRLLIILNNTMNLASGAPLNPPLKGNDEISELDQFLYKSATELRELERFKQEMISVVSHELKSPLSSVEMYLSSLRGGVFGPLSSKAQDKVERTHKSVVRLMGLVKELLYLDRLELEMRPETIRSSELVTASVDSVRALAEQHGIHIEIKNTEHDIFADRNRLTQVIVNLLSNAYKFSPAKGTITLETRFTEGCFECRVSDEGRGIAKDLRNAIFEPFNQAYPGESLSKRGTGLGLTISRSIIEQHGGEIGVESELGNGSTFWFRIPNSRSVLAEGIRPNKQANQTSLLLRASNPNLPVAPIMSTRPAKFKFSKGIRPSRFSVLQQGLTIIAVPLIFQFVFVTIIGEMLHQVREQVHREEHSKEVLDTLNCLAEKISSASNSAMMYSFTRLPGYLHSWERGKKKAYSYFDHLKKLAADDPVEQKNVKATGVSLNKSFSMLDQMVASKRSVDPAGFAELRQSGLGAFASMRMVYQGSGVIEQVKPFLEGQAAQEALMATERGAGEKLAVQRSEIIRTLQIALCLAFALNIGLSTFLAVHLMRNLTSRLQHVMSNMARLLRREELVECKEGNDEIAFLDHTLFETGQRLIELEKFKKELISVVSHELRTPLLSISASLELFGAGAIGPLSTKASNRLQIAREEAGRLIRLINDLLDIEKMEAGKFVLDISEVQIHDLIKASTEAVSSLADGKNIQLKAAAPASTIYGDRDRICQVLINFLSNAIKFSPNGAIVATAVEINESFVEFRVIDCGRGIPEEMRLSIFDRFFQVDKSDASERGGSGLGLAIAKAIVEQHDGKIGVDSDLGVGSTFWFRLPLTRQSIVPSLASISEPIIMVEHPRGAVLGANTNSSNAVLARVPSNVVL